MSWVQSIYIFCSFYMTGVIWLIQLIHYPTFSQINESQFIAFHLRHSTMMSVLVGPVMLAELLAVSVLAKNFEVFWLIQGLLTIFLWFLTFFVSVPIHKQLERGQKQHLQVQLIKTNWPRTIIWTAKAALLINHLEFLGVK